MPGNAEPPRPDTRVLVVDDHTLVREGLRELIGSHPGFAVVGEASDGVDAVAAAASLKPDVVVMDVWLPKLSGVLAVGEIHRIDPKIRILMLSAHNGHGAVMEALRAGASGYLLKSASAGELITAIRALRAGETYLMPSLTGRVVEHAVGPDAKTTNLGVRALTFREREVLQRLAEGLSAPEIAAELHITTRTVESHRASVMRKLGIRKTVGLVRFAIREGLLPP